MQVSFNRSDLIDAGYEVVDVDDDTVMLQKADGRDTVYLEDAGARLIELPEDDHWNEHLN